MNFQAIKQIIRAGIGTTTILLAGVAMSATLTVKLTFSGANEVPPVTTAASGTGTITVGDDMSVGGSVTTVGIDGTAAHFHTGAAGANGPVTLGLTKTGDGVWSVPAGAKFTEEQFKTFKAGGMYINVHSAANKAGEIRAQVLP